MNRLLGVDYGTKKIGIALSDETGSFAFPHSVIECSTLSAAQTVSQIKKICEENNVKKIVLGKSINYKGEANPIMKQAENFKNTLKKATELPTVYQTEILTTQEALRIPTKKEARGNISNTKRVKMTLREKYKNADSAAASIILQSYIDSKRK
jgi:putative Holliday junction resolvase